MFLSYFVLLFVFLLVLFFFQAEDGIRDLVRSRGLGDVYKRQDQVVHAGGDLHAAEVPEHHDYEGAHPIGDHRHQAGGQDERCLLYTSDAADERSSVDLGGRRIIKKKKRRRHT